MIVTQIKNLNHVNHEDVKKLPQMRSKTAADMDNYSINCSFSNKKKKRKTITLTIFSLMLTMTPPTVLLLTLKMTMMWILTTFMM